MKHARKAKSAALGFRTHFSRLKHELKKEPLVAGIETWQRDALRRFATASGFMEARRMLGHEPTGHIRLEL